MHILYNFAHFAQFCTILHILHNRAQRCIFCTIWYFSQNFAIFWIFSKFNTFCTIVYNFEPFAQFRPFWQILHNLYNLTQFCTFCRILHILHNFAHLWHLDNFRTFLQWAFVQLAHSLAFGACFFYIEASLNRVLFTWWENVWKDSTCFSVAYYTRSGN